MGEDREEGKGGGRRWRKERGEKLRKIGRGKRTILRVRSLLRGGDGLEDCPMSTPSEWV